MEISFCCYYVLLIGFSNPLLRVSILFNSIRIGIFGYVVLGSGDINVTGVGVLDDEHRLLMDTDLVLSSVWLSK